MEACFVREFLEWSVWMAGGVLHWEVLGINVVYNNFDNLFHSCAGFGRPGLFLSGRKVVFQASFLPLGQEHKNLINIFTLLRSVERKIQATWLLCRTWPCLAGTA